MDLTSIIENRRMLSMLSLYLLYISFYCKYCLCGYHLLLQFVLYAEDCQRQRLRPSTPQTLGKANEASWKLAVDDETLLGCLKQQYAAGNQSDTGFQLVVWVACAKC